MPDSERWPTISKSTRSRPRADTHRPSFPWSLDETIALLKEQGEPLVETGGYVSCDHDSFKIQVYLPSIAKVTVQHSGLVPPVAKVLAGTFSRIPQCQASRRRSLMRTSDAWQMNGFAAPPEGEYWISAWLKKGTVINSAHLLFPGEPVHSYELAEPLDIPEDGSYAIGVKEDGSDACIIPWEFASEDQRFWAMHSTPLAGRSGRQSLRRASVQGGDVLMLGCNDPGQRDGLLLASAEDSARREAERRMGPLTERLELMSEVIDMLIAVLCS